MFKIFCLCLCLGLSTLVWSQPHERGGPPRREQREPFFQKMPLAGLSSSPLLVTDHGIFLFHAGILSKFHNETLALEKYISLSPLPVNDSKSSSSAPKKAERLVKQVDTDNDGQISKTEFLGKPAQFTFLDQNKDDFISVAELEALEISLPRDKTPERLHGAASLQIAGESLILFVAQHLFKISQVDLAIQAQSRLTHFPQSDHRPFSREPRERNLPPEESPEAFEEDSEGSPRPPHRGRRRHENFEGESPRRFPPPKADHEEEPLGDEFEENEDF